MTKGQGYCGRRCGVSSNLFQILALFPSDEREEDLSEGGMESLDGELLQIVVEGVGDEEVEDWPGQ